MHPPLWHVVACAISAAITSQSNAAEDTVIGDLQSYLQIEPQRRTPLPEQPFATQPLTRVQAVACRKLLVDDWRSQIRRKRAAELEVGSITLSNKTMPFFYKVFGAKPANGRSLFISMHGGGNAPSQVNDQQWRNQQRLYEPEEGVYVAPRAPTDTWNLWHEPHIDQFFERLIEDMIVFEDVDPNRVYILGYSAGGDGVYQLAPRIADRLAAAAMMAGHPNEASPLGLRNIGFSLQVGELDSGYQRNLIAAEWGEKLAKLHSDDPVGYRHLVQIHAGKGHWMDREDAKAIPWMSKLTRNPFPDRIVWKQDDVTHSRFYWLAVDEPNEKVGAEVLASLNGQEIQVESNEVSKITVRLNDSMLDLDRPVTIRFNEQVVFDGSIERTISTIGRTLEERGDPESVYFGERTVDLPPSESPE